MHLTLVPDTPLPWKSQVDQWENWDVLTDNDYRVEVYLCYLDKELIKKKHKDTPTPNWRIEVPIEICVMEKKNLTRLLRTQHWQKVTAKKVIIEFLDMKEPKSFSCVGIDFKDFFPSL